MKTIIFTLLIVLSFVGTSNLFAQADKSATFKITNIPSKQGKIMITTEEGKFYEMTDATETTVEIKLINISNGEYTIYVYHDVNSNFALDRDEDNIPFEYCAIKKLEVTDENREFQIELINYKKTTK